MSAEGLTCLLPVHNQAGALEQALPAWSNALANLGRPYEIIVVDDGSTDGTRKLLEGTDGKKGLISRIPHLRVLEHPVRKGFGASLRDGLAAAQQPLIFYTGCDYAYNPADLKKLLPPLEEIEPLTGQKVAGVVGFRCAVKITGWRKHLGACWRLFLRVAFGVSAPPAPGWLGAKADRYRLLLRILFGMRAGDVDCKFKLFRKTIFERIPIQSTGDFVHAEILAKANFLSCPIAEIPIAERPGPFRPHAEPASPQRWIREMRRVFFRPDFGPAVIEPVPPA